MTQQQRLEIRRLLKANQVGTRRPEDSAKLLAYVEQFWNADESNPSGAADSDSAVFWDYMQEVWAASLAADPKAEDLSSAGAAIDWEYIYEKITGHRRTVDMIGAKVTSTIRPGPADKKNAAAGAAVNVDAGMYRRSGKIRHFIAIKWVAAAVLVIFIGLGGWWLYSGLSSHKKIVINKGVQDLPAPTGARAILILADGRRVALDSLESGLVADQKNVRVALSGTNTLRYDADRLTGDGTNAGGLQYNELQVLRGSQPVSVRLSDGSQVLLNVGSSLRYPTRFTAAVREVFLKGEAYFDVHHDRRRPFIVRHDALAVKVMGTQFNINSYPDEPKLKVTLVEGAVDVEKNGANKWHLLLKPGEQASTSTGLNSALTLRKDVPMEQVLSWKSAEFVFGQGTDFKAIMRQIARWYDVQVHYQGEIHTQFWGSIPRTASIQEVLKLLEATGGVRFELKDRNLMVIALKL